MKKHTGAICATLLLGFLVQWNGITPVAGEEPEQGLPVSSTIQTVRLYQNQARVERSGTVTLKRGTNVFRLAALPDALQDWSVTGSLPQVPDARILSVEVQRKAMDQDHRRRINEIETKLNELREKDLELLDRLKGIDSQISFLKSIINFTEDNAAKELTTRIPQVQVWDDTLRYVTTKQATLSSERRAVERQRQELGKQIQKYEFDLSELAGDDYFRNYQKLNMAVLQNRAAMEVQQFAKFNDAYTEQRRILTNPGSRIKFEKQILIIINSPVERQAELKFSYLIAGTSWSMEYDVRASNTARTLTMVVHATISQNTGEDWNNVALSLSTGAPVTSIRPPSFSPWLLAPEAARREDETRRRSMEMEGASGMADYASSVPRKLQEQTVQVEEKGPYIEISLPHRQSIISSRKQQKKLIAEYALDPSKLEFYYELLPEQSRTAFVRVNLTNTTALPWLPGKAQIFLENEFMGKTDIPFTPAGKKEILTLGIEPRVTASKKLVRTFEDQSGLFQDKRRILYSYQLVVDNQLRTATPVVLSDAFPVSVNDDIKVEIQNLSKPFLEDDELKKTPDFQRGKRTWKINVGANASDTITYDAVITFDKELRVRNLR